MSMKKECKWVSEIIVDPNKLSNDLNIQDKDKNISAESKTWITLSTEAVNDTTSWFERDLDDYLKEIHREIDEAEIAKMEEEEDQIAFITDQRDITKLSKLMDTFNRWDFDVFKYYEILGDQCLLHFGFKIFNYYSLLDKFTIPEQNFNQLLTEINKSFYDKTVYHNSKNTIQVTYNLYYFIRTGKIMQHLSDLNLMAALIASLLHDVGHPGVTNSFLISIKHLKAIRYNDKSILENHHLAIGFKILLDFFESLSEAQSWYVRQQIIRMVLSTDISNHFVQTKFFKGRISSGKFPEDNMEDKQIIMNMLLYASDHSIPCKSTILYFRWMADMMEEIYQQGDIERKLGYDITPFFDRTTSNPFIFQKGYIDVIVRPIYKNLELFIPEIKEDCITNGLEKNIKVIEDKISETKNFANLSVESNPDDEEDLDDQ